MGVTELQIELLGGLRVRTAAGRELRVVSARRRRCSAAWRCNPASRIRGTCWPGSSGRTRTPSSRARACARRSPACDAACLSVLRRCAAGRCRTVVLDAHLASSDVAAVSRADPERFTGCAVARRRTSCRRAARRIRRAFAGIRPVADRTSWRAAASAARRGGARWRLSARQSATTRVPSGRSSGWWRIEPSNERAQRDLMEALARQGRYTDALRQYRVCRDALRRDLDVAPEAATEALHRELMRRRRAVPADDASVDVAVETPAVDTTPPGRPGRTIGGPRSRTRRRPCARR